MAHLGSYAAALRMESRESLKDSVFCLDSLRPIAIVETRAGFECYETRSVVEVEGTLPLAVDTSPRPPQTKAMPAQLALTATGKSPSVSIQGLPQLFAKGGVGLIFLGQGLVTPLGLSETR